MEGTCEFLRCGMDPQLRLAFCCTWVMRELVDKFLLEVMHFESNEINEQKKKQEDLHQFGKTTFLTDVLFEPNCSVVVDKREFSLKTSFSF